MARKNKKKKPPSAGTRINPYVPTPDEKKTTKEKKTKNADPPAHGGQAVRETIESLVIAFVLAFLFRTFQAEAFVIPTGSMAPTLMGMHKDVDCSECGQRYKVNASKEGATLEDLGNRNSERSPAEFRALARCVAGRCPTCRHTMLYQPVTNSSLNHSAQQVAAKQTFNGDRILVNKYIYEFTEPQRWDVIVFKFPGNATTNYIKRLVGLPNEELRIWQGDLFVRPAGSDQPFAIAQKPPSKLLAMRQLVHDTDHDAATLYKAGWPLRWISSVGYGERSNWAPEVKSHEGRALQTYRIDAKGEQTAWLRYEHTPATADAWQAARDNPKLLESRSFEPSLIADYNAYNSEVTQAELRGQIRNGALTVKKVNLGLHWTGDLMLEADITVQSEQGELLLDLVEAGQHFTCTIDLASGNATLTARQYETGEAIESYAPKAETAVQGAGQYSLRFANIDDQLSLWVDGELIEFDADTTYDIQAVFGGRERILPKSGESDRGDLAPAGVGARGAKLAATGLRIYRDIYYIADNANRASREQYRNTTPVTDLPLESPTEVSWESGRAELWDICRSQANWPALEQRYAEEFITNGKQLFVMGDNSAASLDARLWANGNGRSQGGRPGGAYLERSLLIGKAVCVYWPHSWYSVPFTGRRVPAFPNFGDMRLVR